MVKIYRRRKKKLKQEVGYKRAGIPNAGLLPCNCLQPPAHPDLQANIVARCKAMHIGMQSLAHSENVSFLSAWAVNNNNNTEISIIITMAEFL
jgi:hypothetical protein